MNQHYLEFVAILDREEKDEALTYVLHLLEQKTITIQELYEQLLAPSLWNFVCQESEQSVCIWKEHMRTSIIRTILEATYSEIIKQKTNFQPKNKKVVVFTPSEEYHEIGAIMVANYFSMAGYTSQYIGANTPKYDVLAAVGAFKPDYVAISVTNYYNLVVTKQITFAIKQKYPEVKIIVGGQAFSQKDALDQVEHDIYLASLADIFTMSEGELL